jgi:hypothetical protein
LEQVVLKRQHVNWLKRMPLKKLLPEHTHVIVSVNVDNNKRGENT